MVTFIPIKYHTKAYPNHIVPWIQETTATLTTKELKRTHLSYLSLHTEPAYGYKKRVVSQAHLRHEFPILYHTAGVFGKMWVPKLWYDSTWSQEFSRYLLTLAQGIEPYKIKIIEIHPPFDDYCESLKMFLEHYRIFEETILSHFPDTKIHIENRCNKATLYRGGKFILSTSHQMVELAELLSETDIQLRMVVDFPQLFKELFPSTVLTEEMIQFALAPLKQCKDVLEGIHIWGREDAKPPHHGNLDTLFGKNTTVKHSFLQTVWELFNDNCSRYFLPEVNSRSQDVIDIIHDFEETGFHFIAGEKQTN